MGAETDYSKSYMIPSHYLKAIAGYHNFDKGLYSKAIELLTDPAVDADWSADIIRTLTECNQHKLALKFISSQSSTRSAECCSAVLPVLCKSDFLSALNFIRDREAELPSNSFLVLLRECFSPPRKPYIFTLLYTTLTPEEEANLDTYCKNSSAVICKDFIISYYTTRSKYADAIRAFGDMKSSSQRLIMKNLSSCIIPSQRPELDTQNLVHFQNHSEKDNNNTNISTSDISFNDLEMDLVEVEEYDMKDVEEQSNAVHQLESCSSPTKLKSTESKLSSPIISTFVPYSSKEARSAPKLDEMKIINSVPVCFSPSQIFVASTLDENAVKNNLPPEISGSLRSPEMKEVKNAISIPTKNLISLISAPMDVDTESNVHDSASVTVTDDPLKMYIPVTKSSTSPNAFVKVTSDTAIYSPMYFLV